MLAGRLLLPSSSSFLVLLEQVLPPPRQAAAVKVRIRFCSSGCPLGRPRTTQRAQPVYQDSASDAMSLMPVASSSMLLAAGTFNRKQQKQRVNGDVSWENWISVSGEKYPCVLSAAPPPPPSLGMITETVVRFGVLPYSRKGRQLVW